MKKNTLDVGKSFLKLKWNINNIFGYVICLISQREALRLKFCILIWSYICCSLRSNNTALTYEEVIYCFITPIWGPKPKILKRVTNKFKYYVSIFRVIITFLALSYVQYNFFFNLIYINIITFFCLGLNTADALQSI